MSGVTQYEAADNLTVKAVTDDRYVLVTGQNLKRGALLEISSGKMTKATTAANAVAVLVQDTDATAADMRCGYYVTGSVLNEAGLELGGLTNTDVYEALLKVGILVKG